MTKKEYTELYNDNLSKSEKERVKEAIFDYEEKYVARENFSIARKVIFIILLSLGIFILSQLLNIYEKISRINVIAGYVVGAICIFLFLRYYVFLIIKIFSTNYFITNVSKQNEAKAKEHNKKSRLAIAKRIIEFNKNVEHSGWYDGRLVDKLSENINNDVELGKNLKELMDISIKQSSNKIIVDSAVQSGLYAAISQSPILDALLVATVNFKMVKDIIFIYGFRPTTPKLVKVFLQVMINSFAAYGLEGKEIGILIAKSTARFAPGIETFSFAIDAATQALANGTLTLLVGYKTIGYLKKEFNLQDILERVDVLDDPMEYKKSEEMIVNELKVKIPKVSDIFEKNKDNNKDYVPSDTINQTAKNGEVTLTTSSDKLLGMNYKDVAKYFLYLGFKYENINLCKMTDIVIPILSKKGDVKKVLINGSTNFYTGMNVNLNATIDIEYIDY